MKKIIFIGPIPPPYMGPTVATEIILNSNLNNEFDLIHLDTSDHRDLNRLGVIDIQNILLGIKNYVILFWLIIRHWPAMVWIPISQTTVGYIRDAGFILISKLLRRKVICHLRGGNFKNLYSSLSEITRWFVRLVHSFVDGQIVLGGTLKYLFEGIVPKKRIFVVPNGKDIRIDLNRRQESNKIRILYLSNFIREKGILDVLLAIPEVYRDKPRVEFIFAGNWFDDATKKEIESFLQSNCELPVILEGPVYGQNKYNLIFSSDIFVFPTYYPAEGQPWVIVEAMAAGLPIITTDQGAIAESVINGVNGFIVDKKSPRQIAEKIKFLIENPNIRKNMGEKSRRLYLENFTEDKMIERLSYAFNSVLAS